MFSIIQRPADEMSKRAPLSVKEERSSEVAERKNQGTEMGVSLSQMATITESQSWVLWCQTPSSTLAHDKGTLHTSLKMARFVAFGVGL
jgi:hypothetical protein